MKTEYSKYNILLCALTTSLEDVFAVKALRNTVHQQERTMKAIFLVADKIAI